MITRYASDVAWLYGQCEQVAVVVLLQVIQGVQGAGKSVQVYQLPGVFQRLKNFVGAELFSGYRAYLQLAVKAANAFLTGMVDGVKAAGKYQAAKAATASGFRYVFCVQGGFAGNAKLQQGWCHSGLPSLYNQAPGLCELNEDF